MPTEGVPREQREIDRDRELSDAREQAVATEEMLLALGRAGTDPGEILDRIVERAVRLCRAEAGQLYLVEDGMLRLSRNSGSIPEEYRRYVSDHPVPATAAASSAESPRTAVHSRSRTCWRTPTTGARTCSVSRDSARSARPPCCSATRSWGCS